MAKMTKQLLVDFIDNAKANGLCFYNEDALKFELGFYLREKLGPTYKVEFERNVAFFGVGGTVKKEIDIVVYNSNTTNETDRIIENKGGQAAPSSEKYAIELKLPKNGNYPETMSRFIEDIQFVEELKRGGFTATYALVLTDDRLFYNGDKFTEIYRFFRPGPKPNSSICGPIRYKDKVYQIQGDYQVIWDTPNRSKDTERYYIIEVK